MRILALLIMLYSASFATYHRPQHWSCFYYLLCLTSYAVPGQQCETLGHYGCEPGIRASADHSLMLIPYSGMTVQHEIGEYQ